MRLVRRQRLVETFLLQHLGYSWEEVHEEAEGLGHVVSEEFTERLAEMLGHLERDPHGAPIPAPDGALPPGDSRPLSGGQPGTRVVVSRVENRDPAVLAHLRERGLVPGCQLGVREFRGPYAFGAPLACCVFVRDLP